MAIWRIHILDSPWSNVNDDEVERERDESFSSSSSVAIAMEFLYIITERREDSTTLDLSFF